MLIDEVKECIDYAYEKAKHAISMWNDYGMQHIRLNTANLRKIEELRQHNIEEMDERKTMRIKAQKQANYERWKKSADYDPKKDRNIHGVTWGNE